MPVLRQGSSGPDVQDLQQKLKDLGFDPKGLDGNFGAGTKAAVIAFQQSKRLQADGAVGPGTMAALQAATGGPGDPAAVVAAVTGSAATSAAAPAPADAPRLNLTALAGKVPPGVVAQIPEAAKDFNITSNLRLAHFLAQCALESVNFTAVVENL